MVQYQSRVEAPEHGLEQRLHEAWHDIFQGTFCIAFFWVLETWHGNGISI